MGWVQVMVAMLVVVVGGGVSGSTWEALSGLWSRSERVRRCSERSARSRRGEEVDGFYLAIATNTEAALLLPSPFAPCTRSLLLPWQTSVETSCSKRSGLMTDPRPTASSSEAVCRFQPSPVRSRAPSYILIPLIGANPTS